MASFVVFNDPSDIKPTKFEILRGLVTEKMTVAVRKILSVVERTVNAQECEVSFLKEEMFRRKRQMEAIVEPQNFHYKLEPPAQFSVFPESRQSDVETLRDIVTESVSEAVREILAVVERTVTAHKHEVQSLKLELERHKTHMNMILQPTVKISTTDGRRAQSKHEEREIKDHTAPTTCNGTNVVDTLPTEETLLDHEDDGDFALADLPESSVSSPALSEEHHKVDKTNDIHKKNGKSRRVKRLPIRYRSNPNPKDGADGSKKRTPNEKKKLLPSNARRKHLIKLEIGLLPNIADVELSKEDFRLEGPVQTVTCPQRLTESGFFMRLRSVFPELRENKRFEIFLSDGNKTSQTELYAAFKSCKKEQFAFYIQIKDNNGECELPTVTASREDESSTSHNENPSEATRSSNQTDELDDTLVEDSAPIDEDNDDWSEDWEPEKNKDSKEEHDDVNNAPRPEKKTRRLKRQKSACIVNCKVCSLLFRSTAILAKHALGHLNTSKACGVCGEHLDSSEELRRHLETHQKMYHCETCGCIFLTTLCFKKHMDSHKAEKPFSCYYCKKVFPDDESLQEHKLSHNYDDKPFKCDVCPLSFRFKAMLDAHKRTHTGEKPFTCDICDKSVTDFRSLVRHKMIHSGEKNYGCGHCGKLFSTPAQQKSHERIHVAREKTYLCDVCSKAFYTASTLAIHQKTHEASHTTICHVCDKPIKGTLNRHMMIHTGEKPFSCSECGLRVRTQTHLVIHMRTHLGIKPYTCAVCEYTCRRKHHLAVHMRTHTGHKPYQCTRCDKAFTQSHCLKSHMKCHQTEEEAAAGALD